MQPFIPTHRITVTEARGTVEHRESFTVMLVDGPAYTEVEWSAEAKADWERTDDGEWRFHGDLGAFHTVKVEPIVDESSDSFREISYTPQNRPGALGGSFTIKEWHREPIARVHARDLLKQGGAWLGAVRQWLKRNTRNGDRVTWGSNDSVGEFAARKVEDLAAEVAAAVVNERQGARKLARAVLDRSKSEDECNTIEDAVALAKLVLGEE